MKRKRVEEAALKAYPDYPSMDGGYVTQRKQRHCYIKGYEQAENDTIERIIGYLGERDLEHTILGFDIFGYAYIDFECLKKLIRKAIEE